MDKDMKARHTPFSDAERQLAAKLFADECRANGALMIGGFGFMSPEAKRPYLNAARAQLAKAST